MNRKAKIVSLALSIALIFTVIFSIAVSVNAEGAPSFTVKSSKDGNTLTLSVELTSGKFNSIDGQFAIDGEAECKTIKIGSAWKEFRDELEEDSKPAPVNSSNPATGRFSAATTVAYDKDGSFFVATFEVDDSQEYTITFEIDSCTVTEGDSNVAVEPVIENAVYSNVPAEDPDATPTDADDPTDDPATPTDADDPTDDPATPTDADDPTDDPATPTDADDPTDDPADDPSDDPTDDPSDDPSDDPTEDPSEDPADDPSDDPADDPSENPADVTDKEDDSKAADDNTSENNYDAVKGTEDISPNTGVSTKLALCAVVTAASGCAVTFILRKKNETEE